MNKFTFYGFLIIITALLLFSSNGWAYGKIGHRVTGQIAYNHLSDKAKKEIQKLLGDDSLAEISNWPDSMRSNQDVFWQKHSTSWHYVSIPDGETYASIKRNPKGDIYQAIITFKAILANQELPNGIVKERLESYFGKLNKKYQTKQVKTFAIKFLMHLVGDIHQPMHVGYASDRGGNDIQIKWFREGTNLHRVWDSHLIDNLQLSYTELVDFIDIDDEKEINRIQLVSIDNWMQEAMKIRTEAYKIGKGNLRYNYIYQHSSTVKEQLVKAGLRMAAILNEVYGD